MTEFGVRFESGWGEMCILGDGSALTRVSLPGGPAPGGEWRSAPDDPLLREAVRQLAEYFAGRRRDFDLPLAPAGSPFQLSVWRELARIPYGATASYRDIAIRIGNARAVRAVGGANHRNPIPIIIPCHRVVGADGSLVGFGGGLPLKRRLLDFEAGKVTPRSSQPPR